MKIAGKYTNQDWIELKKRLESEPNKSLWDVAYKHFYRTRIDTRYLYPINYIHQHDTQLGEGFAIAALFCSLIEFLESCERGDNFRYIGNSNNRKLQSHEYSERQASSYFKDFLKNRLPFNSLIPSTLVDRFYQDVRCGLLHEARTKRNWYLSSKQSKGKLISQEQGKITLFRNQLIPALNLYFDDYRKRLLVNLDTQKAFIRKFDHLCK
jgi:hypothetical protein